MIGQLSHILPLKPQKAGKACKGYCLGRQLDFPGRSQGVRVQHGEQREPLCRSPSRRGPLLSRQPEPVAKREAQTDSRHRQQIYNNTSTSPLPSNLEHGCISLLRGYAPPADHTRTPGQSSRNTRQLPVPSIFIAHPPPTVPTLRNHSAAAIISSFLCARATLHCYQSPTTNKTAV